jgi:hypothetical protein
MRERTIVKAEKNRISKALFVMAAKYPNPDIWIAVDPDGPTNVMSNLASYANLGLSIQDIQNIAAEPRSTYINQSGLLDTRINPQLRNSRNVLHLMVDGKDKLIFFNAKSETATRLVDTLKNANVQAFGTAMQHVGAVTRWFAAINTQFNPIFGVINLMRDVQTGMFNLTSTPIAGMQGRVFADTKSAMIGIWKQIRAERSGTTSTDAWAKLYEEFESVGGPTGYRQMYESTADRAADIEKEFKNLSRGKLMESGAAIFGMLSDYNTALENAVRLSAYKAAKEKFKNLPPEEAKDRAASLAKNLTVNFNRKGDITQQAGALYAFFNASVQGTARLAETLRGPKGRKIIYGGLTLGVMQAMALAAAGFDEDQPPDFVKEKNLVIPTGNGKYLTVPLPLGLNVLPNIGRTLTEIMMGKASDAPKKFASLLGATINSFNPAGGGTLAQILAPTVLDPVVALVENKDSFGRRIYREDVSGLRPTPGFTRTKETATAWAKGMAFGINYITGGTYAKQGLLSPTPDQIDYLLGQATGGLGREISKTAQTVSSAYTGEELPSYKIPLVSRFYGDTEEAASQSSKYYTNLTRLNEHAAEIKDLRKHPEHGSVSEYIKDNPEARLSASASHINETISNLNSAKKKALEKDLPRERIKQIETQIQLQMKRLNDRVKQLSQ